MRGHIYPTSRYSRSLGHSMSLGYSENALLKRRQMLEEQLITLSPIKFQFANGQRDLLLKNIIYPKIAFIH